MTWVCDVALVIVVLVFLFVGYVFVQEVRRD